ncbi:MAG: DUF2267 domain-containing protein [Actinomycetota bacterium]|nr:DUF2267 domain-containing protein [Actinomycetota bacterium]
MKHDEFIGYVQARARLDSRGAAEQATRATLETLATRLGGGLPSNIAAQLPPELGLHLERSEDETDRFGITEFYERVAQAESAGTDLPQGAFHARAVVSVLRDAVTQGTVDNLRDALPAEFSELFTWEGGQAGA